MKTWRKFTLDTQTTSTISDNNVRRRATPGMRSMNWYDLGYIGFLITAACAIIAGLFC